ncbi:unnamed protein product [Anisakis simplex]|uniref:NUC domain-containing protein n=1 Tax=Anisakis simplex TaxID=6269 RepID=A0A0M3JTQ9_ANISI|nr:unnamed protein product [Anisakis simplex]
MYASYPSKTFPNHHTIATGLYPEAHGIIDNNMYDANISREPNSRKYHNGEPLRSELLLQISKALRVIDSTLNYLLEQLRSLNLIDCVNLLVISDHAYSLDELKETLRCADDYLLYDKMSIPRRYHFTVGKRIGDLIIEGRPGTILFLYDFSTSKKEDSNVTADHGYNFLESSMRTIFFAQGPDIAVDVRLPPFQNIELFSLMNDLLRLKAPPNNGTEGSLDAVFRHAPKRQSSTNLRALTKCISEYSSLHQLTPCGHSCNLSTTVASLSGCINNSSSSLSFSNMIIRGDSSQYCIIPLCSAFIITSESSYATKMLVERLSSDDDYNEMTKSVQSVDQSKCFITVGDPRKCTCSSGIDEELNELRNESTERHSFAVKQYEGYAHLDLQIARFTNHFYGKTFKNLQKLTAAYLRKYKKLVVMTGTVYDLDNDGVHDREYSNESEFINTPTHLFRILIRCNDTALWSVPNGQTLCKSPAAIRLISFILPHTNKDLNCLEPLEELALYTARIRDIELLMGMEFFGNRTIFDYSSAVHLRTYHPQELWDLAPEDREMR